MNDKTPYVTADGPSGDSRLSVLGLESGSYESDAGPEHVWVRRASTGETVRARVEGYPADFAFEAGDETGIELVDGVWHALPSVVHTVALRTRIEWWTRNRRTGQLRFLTERHLAPDPADEGNRAQPPQAP